MMLVCIKGAGDIASGIALRLFRSRIRVIMTEIENPLTVRRTVSFSEAVRLGACSVEGVPAKLTHDSQEAIALSEKNIIPVIISPDGKYIREIKPAAVVDSIMAKRNLCTKITDAHTVIGVGPGFTVGTDCHAVIETKRGHNLGRAIYGYGMTAERNTGIPGNICGYKSERLLRAPCEGVFIPRHDIGDIVRAGEIVATVNGENITAEIDGLIRGLLAPGIFVERGMKAGDIDPRGESADCHKVSDKALAVGGGVLEALLHFRCLA